VNGDGSRSTGCQLAAAAWNQNAALRVMSPIAAELEEVVLRWVLRHWNCLRNARGAWLPPPPWRISRRSSRRVMRFWHALDGMSRLTGCSAPRRSSGRRRGSAFIDSEGVELGGIWNETRNHRGSRRQGRMRADKLPRLSERTIVCIQAGNVNSGAFDPAGEICKVARKQGAWVHVDGAFGLWARILRSTNI